MYRELATGSRTFCKGETILAQGTMVEYLYLLQSGSCYRSLITDRGDSIIYEIKEADNALNSMIGTLAIYNKSSASRFAYIARSSCECMCIPAKVFWYAWHPCCPCFPYVPLFMQSRGAVKKGDTGIQIKLGFNRKRVLSNYTKICIKIWCRFFLLPYLLLNLC